MTALQSVPIVGPAVHSRSIMISAAGQELTVNQRAAYEEYVAENIHADVDTW
jgi:hypothetical protein